MVAKKADSNYPPHLLSANTELHFALTKSIEILGRFLIIINSLYSYRKLSLFKMQEKC